MRHRVTSWPNSLIATSTHDSKRGEDMRARLTVLSEMPDLWAETVEGWGRRSDAHRIAGQPDRNFEYYLYQTLVGAWPLTRERAHVHAEKAAREAKLFTDWLNQSPDYERAIHHFVDGVYDDAPFIAELSAFVERLHPADWIKSLAQQLLKLTMPGVPDLYQGSELWYRRLVDPDNRMPVDYGCRRSLLDQCGRLTPSEVLARADEGLPKLWTTTRALQLRARHADLDPAAPFTPVEAQGPAAGRLFAFLRGRDIAVIVPTRTWQPDWRDTRVTLPEGQWSHVLADTTIAGGDVDVDALLASFPVALLERRPG
jgi:(1->4)-alpha-D-glucan 1-alpha-D-glucosylmutase